MITTPEPTEFERLPTRDELRAKELLRDPEAALYLGVSISFLRKGRMEGARQDKTPPPPFIKIGRLVRYQPKDLDAWLESRKVSR